MLDMWATSKGASEAASASNSSSSSIGGPSSTPPISGGDRGSISTPGSIKGLKNILIFFLGCVVFILILAFRTID